MPILVMPCRYSPAITLSARVLDAKTLLDGIAYMGSPLRGAHQGAFLLCDNGGITTKRDWQSKGTAVKRKRARLASEQ